MVAFPFFFAITTPLALTFTNFFPLITLYFLTLSPGTFTLTTIRFFLPRLIVSFFLARRSFTDDAVESSSSSPVSLCEGCGVTPVPAPGVVPLGVGVAEAPGVLSGNNVVDGVPVGAGVSLTPGVGAGVSLTPGVGSSVGTIVGSAVGFTVGSAVGAFVGSTVGAVVGTFVGTAVGAFVGTAVGFAVGFAVGAFVGTAVGFTVGVAVGAFVGTAVGFSVAASLGLGDAVVSVSVPSSAS